MSTNCPLSDVHGLLRAFAPPLLTIGTLLLVGEARATGAWVKAFEVSRQAAVVLAGLWLVTALVWAVLRPKRDAHAHQRLQELRNGAQAPRRALVYVQTSVWSSGAGQHAVVVNVASGHIHRLWLPETHLSIGCYALLEQREAGAAVVDWVDARVVATAHRHEQRRAHLAAATNRRAALVKQRQEGAAAARLVRETEEVLKAI